MKKILAIVVSLVLGVATLNSPVVVAHQIGSNARTFGAVETNILTGCGSKDGEEAINCVLGLVVDIMTIGIGILGVIGISVSGVQYLTAGGNEEKTRKAKRRIFEIVIGLVAYVLIYDLLKWLLPSL